MENISINELKNHFDEEVVVSGFVDNIRNLQWVQFVILRDNTAKVQVTIEKSEDANKEMVELIETLPLESTVKITGKLVDSPKVKLNGMEIIPTNIEVTSKSSEELPFNFKDLEGVNLDTRLDYRFIDLRNDKNLFMFQVQSTLVRFMREYLYNNNFTEIHTPKFIGAASESGADVFEVKYFDRVAYLAQSPQFYKQMAMASGLNKIFEVAPCFRAENSNTSRHATEFTSFDVEFSYIDSYEDVMNLEAEMLAYKKKKTNEIHKDKIKELFTKYDGLILPVGTGPAKKLDGSTIVNEEEIALDEHLQIGDFGGFPSITIPNGFINGLPVGVNITGNCYDDQNVLNIAYALEKTMDYKDQIAPILGGGDSE